jgi:hypothetical protein
MKTIPTVFNPGLCAIAAFALAMGATTAKAQYRFEPIVPPTMPAGDNCETAAINNVGEAIVVTWNPASGQDDAFYL